MKENPSPNVESKEIPLPCQKYKTYFYYSLRCYPLHIFELDVQWYLISSLISSFRKQWCGSGPNQHSFRSVDPVQEVFTIQWREYNEGLCLDLKIFFFSRLLKDSWYQFGFFLSRIRIDQILGIRIHITVRKWILPLAITF